MEEGLTMRIVETEFGHVTVFPVVKTDGSGYDHMQTDMGNFYPFDAMEIGDVALIESFRVFVNMRYASRGKPFKCTKSDPRHNGMHTCERIE